MSEQNVKYKFENLQPINFLKRFNKMVDDDDKNPVITRDRQLKVFPLTRFPLPEFYKKMEGIFETGVKKKDIASINTKSKDEIQEEQFLDKHRVFMTKHIQKVIGQNQAFQVKLIEQKKYLQKKMDPQQRQEHALRMLKMRSQPKLKRRQKTKIGKLTTRQTQQNIIEGRLKNADISNDNEEQVVQQRQKLTYFEKVQKKRMQNFQPKKQTIRLKDKKQINNFLEVHKRLKQEPKRSLSHLRQPYEYNNMDPQDFKKNFIGNLFALKQEQTNYQRRFDKKIEETISNFNTTINQSIRKVKSQKYW